MPRPCWPTTNPSGIPVVNPVAAYRFEKSKALQLGLFERVGARYPRSVVVNHPIQALGALDKLRLPVVVKPNVGGSGAGIVRVDSKAELEAAVDRLDLGPDGTALVQEYLEPDGGRDRAHRGAGRGVSLRDPHRARCPGRVQPVPGRHLPDARCARPPLRARTRRPAR